MCCSTLIFNFTLKGKRPSISFYSEAFFGSKPIDTAYVRSGLIAARYVIRGRPIVVALNYGGCLKCSTSRRAVDRSLKSIGRAFARQTIAHAAFDESLLANSYNSPTNPRRSLSRDLYTALGESNLRLIRSTFRRSRCFAVC